MATVRYTSTAVLPIEYMWKCSSCGKINRASQAIDAKGKNISGGSKFQQKASDVASERASGVLHYKLSRLSGETGNYWFYKSLELDCKCARCQHREIWARRSILSLVAKPLIIGLLLMPLSLIIVLMFKLPLEWLDSIFFQIIGTGEVLVLFAALVLDYILLPFWINMKLKTLPLSSFPVLVQNGKPVAHKEYFTNDVPDEKRAVSPIAEKMIVYNTTAKAEKAAEKNTPNEAEKQKTEVSIAVNAANKFHLSVNSAYTVARK